MESFMTDTAKPITLDSITETVNNVINAAMSRAIAERDKLVQIYQGSAQEAAAVRSRVADAAEQMNRIEKLIHREEAESLRRMQTLREQAEDVLRLVARIKDHRALGCVELVGKQVTIVGGKQRMVASGLDEDGLMVCFYEHDNAVGVQEIAIPPQALVLADTQVGTTKPEAKTRTARTARGVKATSTPSP